jgi:hypothetical protein
MEKPRAMIYPEAIAGTAFGCWVLYLAILDAGKLAAGPVRPAKPPPTPPKVTATVEPEKEPLNGAEITLELDAEEKATIARVSELRSRLESRRKALEAAGLEITNLDKWN